MYDNILVPTDGSRFAETAARHGLSLAEAFEATVHVLSVADARSRNERRAELRAQDAVTVVEEVVERESDVSYHSAVEHGNPYEVILSYASENDIDLIVMGTHGQSGLDRFLVGSVTQRVVRTSDVPVLAVPPSSVDREATGYDTVLIPTDGSPAADAVVDYGVAIAERFEASVRVLYVIEGVRGLPSLGEPLRDEAVEVVESVAEQAAEYDVALTTHVQSGTPHEVIADFASACGIDLIAMGTHGRSGVRSRLLGSVTEKILRTSEVPILTVRQDIE